MSLYNLQEQTALKYYLDNREKLLSMSNKEYAHAYFLVGKKVNKQEQRFYTIMNELLCTENCELINYINDKINDRLDISENGVLQITPSNVRSPNIIYNITQVIKEEMEWESVQW